MLSFANMSESVKNMRIQDEATLYQTENEQPPEATLYQQKMNSLLDLEEDGFQVSPLKVRLNNLLCTRNRQTNLKNRKARLEQEILKIETDNCILEEQVKLLDMCITGMDQKKYQEMRAFVDMQKAGNRLSISALHANLRQVEDSLAFVEANFRSIAVAPWESDVGSETHTQSVNPPPLK